VVAAVIVVVSRSELMT